MSFSRQNIKLKSADQVDKMQASAEILASVFLDLREAVAPGVTTGELDRVIEAKIRDAGCIPSFKGYHGFPGSACISVNEEVVHGIPGERELVDGDIVGIDIGLIRDGWHADSAETLPVGTVSPEAAKLLRVTEECQAHIDPAIGTSRCDVASLENGTSRQGECRPDFPRAGRRSFERVVEEMSSERMTRLGDSPGSIPAVIGVPEIGEGAGCGGD